jgi:hypothetical protein
VRRFIERRLRLPEQYRAPPGRTRHIGNTLQTIQGISGEVVKVLLYQRAWQSMQEWSP